MPDDDGVVRCASYTHARRHPMVLGRIAGWSPPVQLSITQVVVILVSFVGLTWSWSLWAPHLPSSLSLLIAVGVPVAAAWAVRHLRVEGRSVARTGLGYLTLLSAPRTGRLGGRPYRAARPVRSQARIWVSEAPR
jgi:hypothetical protein